MKHYPSNRSFSVALCGVLVALAIVCMLIASLFPVLGVIVPCIAGLFVLVIRVELGIQFALTSYFAIALLGFILVPDKEVVLLFTLLLGYYPLLKAALERLHPNFFGVLCKCLLLNIAIALNVMLFYLVFPVASIAQEIALIGTPIIIAGFAVCQFAFFVYDKALVNLLRLYRYRWRKKIFGQFLKRKR
ncbi:MAG: hypothetical protein R3Y06_05515 [Faecalibacterium sp.]